MVTGLTKIGHDLYRRREAIVSCWRRVTSVGSVLLTSVLRPGARLTELLGGPLSFSVETL